MKFSLPCRRLARSPAASLIALSLIAFFALTGCQTGFLAAVQQRLPAMMKTEAEPEPDREAAGYLAERRAKAYRLVKLPFSTVAKSSRATLMMAPNRRLACAEIKVLERDARGKPVRVLATGQVFLDLDFEIPLRALADEAVITPQTVELRGHAALKRGLSLILAKDEATVFRLDGETLQVEGQHEILKEDDLIFGEEAVLKPHGAWQQRRW